jgi:hypothetical protein
MSGLVKETEAPALNIAIFILEGTLICLLVIFRFVLRVISLLANSRSLIPTLFSKLSHLRSARKARINKPPGTVLLSIVDFLYSPKIVEETFKPIAADWRTEYFDALKQTRDWKAKWISIRYTYRFILAMGLSKFFSVVRGFISANK